MRTTHGQAGYVPSAVRAVSQVPLAFDAQVSRNYVSLLELNEKSPTVDVLLRICRAMGVSAADIIRAVEIEQEAE